MGNVKPWQIVVMVIAVVAVAASAYFSFSGKSDVKFASEITMVDVNTGDLFAFPVSRRQVVIPPEANPDTGKKTLLRVNKNAAGKWVLDGREVSAILPTIEGDHKAVIDRKTGEVRVTNEKPRSGR
jgi:hypothetical protein